MEVRAWPEAEVPEAIRRQVAALQQAAWPDAGAAGAGHDPRLRPVTLALVHRRLVLGALAILSKHIAHRGEQYAGAGLSTVVTAPAERRRGHGRTLIVAAREEMGRAGADLAIFTCDPALVPFYTGGGYLVLPGAVLVGGTPEDPLPSDRLGKAVVWSPLSGWAREHEADFHGATVGLYPGTIDRLW